VPDHVAESNLDLLASVVDRLATAGIEVLVFGGWAEELSRLSAPRPHRDIDLLLPAQSLAAVDRFIAGEGRSNEIRGKRFAHKRALLVSNVPVEITLVGHDPEGPVTRFWGDTPFRWLVPLCEPEPVRTAVRAFAVVSRANLARYRELHDTTQPWRWGDPASLLD
jgi:Aminoglycoside-2''-adenylyltransferase